MSLRARHARRLQALVQVGALWASLGLGYEVSQCPPGMDMGMEMGMDMAAMADAGAPAGEHGGAHHHDDGSGCPWAGTQSNGEGAACPFAVGGVGPCGTTVSAAGATWVAAAPEQWTTSVASDLARTPADFLPAVLSPPPRV